MAAIVPDNYSNELTAYLALPSTFAPLKPIQRLGKMRVAYFFSQPIAAVAATKVIALCLLKKGSRILNVKVTSNAFVATSTLDVGLVGADGLGTYDGTNADSATFFTGGGTLAVATAGAYNCADTQANNYGYELLKDCYLIAKLNTAGMDGSADILKGHVTFASE